MTHTAMKYSWSELSRGHTRDACSLHTIVCILHVGCIRSYAWGRRWNTLVLVVIYEYL